MFSLPIFSPSSSSSFSRWLLSLYHREYREREKRKTSRRFLQYKGRKKTILIDFTSRHRLHLECWVMTNSILLCSTCNRANLLPKRQFVSLLHVCISFAHSILRWLRSCSISLTHVSKIAEHSIGSTLGLQCLFAVASSPASLRLNEGIDRLQSFTRHAPMMRLIGGCG